MRVIADGSERFSTYRIRFSTAKALKEDYEHEDFVTEIQGEIVYFTEGGKESVIGEIHGTLLDVERIEDEGYSLLEVCDADSAGMCQLYETLFDPDTDSLREELLDEEDTLYDGSVIYIHELKIEDAHRRKRLGLLAVLRLLQLFGKGCALAVLPNVELDAQDDDRDVRFLNYWARLGFRLGDASEYLLLPITRTLPTPKELARPGLRMAERASEDTITDQNNA